MADKGLWKKEISAGRIKLLVGLAVLAIAALVVALTYDIVNKYVGMGQVPDFARDQVKLLKDYKFFIWTQWFGKNLMQSGVILAVAFGAGVISTEISRQTMHFLLAKPIRRSSIFTAKYVVNYIILTLSVIISTMVLYIGVIATGHSYSLLQLMEGAVIAVAGLGVVFSIASCFSAVFDRTLTAVAASAVAAFVLYVPGFFPALAKYSLFYHLSGPGIIRGEGFPFLTLAVFILSSAGLYLLGRTRFAGRDL